MQKFLSGIGGVLFALVFTAAGILCLVLGIGRIAKLNAGQFEKTQATITKIESTEVYDPDTGYSTEYDITVQYEVDGKTYVSQLGETPKEFHEGMELTVLYNKTNPTEIVLPGTTGAIVMICIGVVGLLCGAFLILQKLRGR